MTVSRLVILSAIVLAAASQPAAAAPRPPQECGASFSPDGRHRASFSWKGGRTVEAVACSFRCETVLTVPRSEASYRWSGPERLDFMSTDAKTETRIAQVEGLSVYRVPLKGAAGATKVRIPRDCTPVEEVVIED